MEKSRSRALRTETRVVKRALYEQLRSVLWSASPPLFDRLVQPHRGQKFSIGIYQGASPLAASAPDGRINPIMTHEQVTDAPAAFVADPFMFRHEGRCYLFMEIYNRVTRRGQIAVAQSADGYAWTYQRTVLKEPFHLAYPNVFRWEDCIYMIPDAPGHGARLYRSFDFPYDWHYQRTLLDEKRLSDSTVFRFEGRWWMMTGWRARREVPMSLRLFYASNLEGTWTEHPMSPIVRENDAWARPAGRVLCLNGRPVRFAQDCSEAYGSRVYAFEVVVLTTTEYRERELSGRTVLEAGDAAWNAGGMHHLDAHAPAVARGPWIAYVDGWSP